ncbi:hypothetical protein GCK32_016350 [Trichostrongylus colubriformis]|uniref:Integrase catalytic domain-containing protein n=1 Tax=Trichostrongylus colubriformis TaxID=6319 RepID=A0AAN8FKN8_TRICO
MAEKGILWKANTPYAPWQGAIYERLIKSIKHSLYKVMQRTVPAQEFLETLLVEIEGTINCRPITYQEERWDETPILRPIDFIQRDLVTGYPFETIGGEEADDKYQPSEEAAVLKTRPMEEAAPIDAAVKATKKPEQAIKANTTASKTVRPEKSMPATKTTSDTESSALPLASSRADDIKGLCERFDDLSLRLPRIDTPRNVTPVEPSPELDRIRRQIDETEKELQGVR